MTQLIRKRTMRFVCLICCQICYNKNSIRFACVFQKYLLKQAKLEYNMSRMLYKYVRVRCEPVFSNVYALHSCSF